MSRWSRRELFTRVAPAVAVGAALPACTDGPTGPDDTGSSDGTDSTDDTEPPLPAWCQAVAGSAAEGWTEVRLSDHPALRDVGGSTVLVVRGQRINLAQVEEGCFVAMGTTCTHEGCTVEVRDNPGPRFVCPCHGALFDWEGVPIAGPAPDPLPTFPAALRDDSVWVHIEG